mgnify:CR=1 FL=1
MRSHIFERKSHKFNLNALSVNHLSIGFWREPDQSRMVSVHQRCLTPCIMKHKFAENMKSDLNLSPLQQVMQLSVHFWENKLVRWMWVSRFLFMPGYLFIPSCMQRGVQTFTFICCSLHFTAYLNLSLHWCSLSLNNFSHPLQF